MSARASEAAPCESCGRAYNSKKAGRSLTVANGRAAAERDGLADRREHHHVGVDVDAALRVQRAEAEEVRAIGRRHEAAVRLARLLSAVLGDIPVRALVAEIVERKALEVHGRIHAHVGRRLLQLADRVVDLRHARRRRAAFWRSVHLEPQVLFTDRVGLPRRKDLVAHPRARADGELGLFFCARPD